jgi:hypothetical protein
MGTRAELRLLLESLTQGSEQRQVGCCLSSADRVKAKACTHDHEQQLMIPAFPAPSKTTTTHRCTLTLPIGPGGSRVPTLLCEPMWTAKSAFAAN